MDIPVNYIYHFCTNVTSNCQILVLVSLIEAPENVKPAAPYLQFCKALLSDSTACVRA